MHISEQQGGHVPILEITQDNPDQLHRVTSIVASAFRDVPMSRAVLSNLDGDFYSPTHPIAQERRVKHYTRQIRRLADHNAKILVSADFSVTAVWVTPSSRSWDGKTTTPLAEEYIRKLDRVKQRHIHVTGSGRRKKTPLHYYLDFLARDPEKLRVRGAISAVITPILDRARQEGLPVWLEAATEHAVQIYKYYGFRVVEEVKCGVGSYDAEGWPKQGGEGVSTFAMIYDGHLRKEFFA